MTTTTLVGRKVSLSAYARSLLALGARLVKALENRRAVSKLRALDERMLADIGLTRFDVDGALAAPLTADPSHLLIRAREERRYRRRARCR